LSVTSSPFKAWLHAHLQAAWLRRGLWAWAMWIPSQFYAVLVRVRRWLYQKGFFKAECLPVPVVVVGNWVVGGAGKTPTLLALIELLRKRGYVPGVISRGYGRETSHQVLNVQPATPATRCGDEPLLIHLRSKVPVVVGRDRLAAGQHLLERHRDVNVILCDDGLQHWRLRRDVEVLVWDERGVGNGFVLPAGLLREPLPLQGLKATAPMSGLCAQPTGAQPTASLPMVIYNATRATTPLEGVVVQRRLRGVSLLQDWWHGGPASLAALHALRGRLVWVAAGLARPERFFDMLRAHGLSIHTLVLPDHYPYTTCPWPDTAGDVVVSEKDAVKLAPASGLFTKARVWVAPLDFELPLEWGDALMRHLPPSHS
jgi:tetraacyldisaccharide 4'-kinase